MSSTLPRAGKSHFAAEEGGPVRVLITLPWGERLGGAEAMLKAVLDGAHETEHELELVFLAPGSWPNELARAGFRVEVIPAGRLREVHRWTVTVARLAALMRARRPDLILNWAAKTQLYGAPAAMLAGMGDRAVWWQQNIPSGDWIDRCATLLPARAIGCYSQAAARAQRRLWPRRATFVVAAGAPVPYANGDAPLERSVVAGDAPESPTGSTVVGVVGRLQPWKGQDRMLRAQALLRERGHDVRLMIVGGDAYGLSTEYAESLPALARDLGLDGAVTLTGQVPDAGPYIERMDMLVNASDPEPFGIVLLEAMARGVPVVAVDSGGPAEFIEDGRTGMLARSGEPSALADALEPLLASPELRHELGRAGRERFLSEFTDVALRERFFHRLEVLVAGRAS
jgi:glycosyltransferase involved in cell wall biosynthesis